MWVQSDHWSKQEEGWPKKGRESGTPGGRMELGMAETPNTGGPWTWTPERQGIWDLRFGRGNHVWALSRKGLL